MARTHEQFVDELRKLNDKLIVLGTYTKSTESIRVECIECGKVWSPKAYSLLQGKSCPHCSAIRGARNNKGKTALKSVEKFITELREVDDSIEIQGEYVNTHTDIRCTCKLCLHEWSAKPYSLLQGHGCPRCVKSGTSFMEQFIKTCFCFAVGKDKVISRDKETIGLELDIWIPDRLVAIEPGSWNLHKHSISRDARKRLLCEEKGIRLYTIYDVFPENIEKPFKERCITFKEDLNKANHDIILSLVYDLFMDIGIDKAFTKEEIVQIENIAYKQAKAKLHEDFIKEIASIHPTIEILDRYQNTNKRVHVVCKVCGYEWEAVPANLLVGDGCKRCGTRNAHEKFVKEQSIFVEELKMCNPNVEIIGEYVGRHQTVLTRCKICGYEWLPRASSLLRGSSHKGWQRLHEK